MKSSNGACLNSIETLCLLQTTPMLESLLVFMDVAGLEVMRWKELCAQKVEIRCTGRAEARSNEFQSNHQFEMCLSRISGAVCLPQCFVSCGSEVLETISNCFYMFQHVRQKPRATPRARHKRRTGAVSAIRVID